MRAVKNQAPDFDLEKKNTRSVYILFGISLIFFLLIRVIPEKSDARLMIKMKEASELMARALTALGECRFKGERGSKPAAGDLPVRDAVLGQEMSPITTSLGSLPSKRTSVDPNLAGLMVFLLNKAGIKSHETIAVGASGSFPALIVATLAAARTMEIHPVWICSLGASQWGANDPDFHWLRMWACLEEKKIFSVDPVAVSLGGEGDTGGGMETEGRELLRKAAEKSGLPFIYEPDLKKNVALRMQLYQEASPGQEIRVFVNIGGGIANIGTDSEILNLRPGLVMPEHIPPPERRGVLFEMAGRGIRIIHLLYMKGLSSRFGIDWNPEALPRPGESGIYKLAGGRSGYFVLIVIFYLVLVLTVMTLMAVSRRRYWLE
ncbi:MAG: poly-gamma-glutamate system protein [Candidatus Aminicenantes bacterium]|nr:poly-gamma-glutamate system protein [Candidatus Aminicenantes bacterium]